MCKQPQATVKEKVKYKFHGNVSLVQARIINQPNLNGIKKHVCNIQLIFIVENL